MSHDRYLFEMSNVKPDILSHTVRQNESYQMEFLATIDLFEMSNMKPDILSHTLRQKSNHLKLHNVLLFEFPKEIISSESLFFWLICEQLQQLVVENVLAFNENFWLRLAARTDTCKSEDDKARFFTCLTLYFNIFLNLVIVSVKLLCHSICVSAERL